MDEEAAIELAKKSTTPASIILALAKQAEQRQAQCRYELYRLYFEKTK